MSITSPFLVVLSSSLFSLRRSCLPPEAKKTGTRATDPWNRSGNNLPALSVVKSERLVTMNRNLTPNLPWNTMRNASTLLAAAAFAIGIAGCRVQVDKGEGGADKNVQVDTPFGGVHVNTNQTSAADLVCQLPWRANRYRRWQAQFC